MAKGKGKKLPEYLTDQEREALLAQPNPKAPTGLRNLCMLRLMLDAGLRSAECLHVHVDDVDWMSGRVKVVQGKGSKDRFVWIGQELLELLRRWRERRPVQADLLFTTLTGEELAGRYLRALVERLALKAGIARPKAHPHTLRHTFATDIYKATKDIRLVQKALGHADLSSTMIYTHIVDEALEEAMRTFRAA